MLKRIFVTILITLLIITGYSIGYGQDASQSTVHLPIIMVDGNGSVEATVTVVILPPTDATNTPTPTLIETVGATPTTTSTPTPVSTSTSTNTPTTTPTMTHTPVSTVTPGKVALVGRVMETMGDYGPIYVGEVENQTGHTVSSVEVSITGYDSVGKVIFVESSYTGLGSIHAGEKTCFAIYTYNGTTLPVRISGVTTWWNSAGGYVPLSVEGVSINFSTLGYPQVLGMLRNNSTEKVTFPMAIVTLYDVNGNAIGCHTGYGVLQNLSAGETTSFKVMFSERRTIGRYVVVGEAYR